MDIFLNIIQGVLGLAFLAAGGMKAAQSKEQLAGNMAWVEDFSDMQVRLIGIAEVLGGLALILSIFITSPTALLLGGIAAICLAILMGGAAYTHIRRGEMNQVTPGVVLGILSLIMAYTLLI
ncbi:MAG: DoxX family protein [Chloroflexota bacterium]